VSDAPGMPRILAAMLGVEVPMAAAPGRVGPPPPPAGAVPRRPAEEAPLGRSARTGRLSSPGPRDAGRQEPKPRAARESHEAREEREAEVARRKASDGLAGSVRRVLDSPATLRTAVLVAAVLGPPRALRPYGADGS
jgi:hypothetical protein